MSVPFGFVPGTPVLTVGGDRPIDTLAPGDVVVTHDPATGADGRATIVAIPSWTVDHVVAIDLGGPDVRGTAPGTNLWDAFEVVFRAAASLSSLSELLVHGEGGVRAHPVLEVPERHEPGVVVRHLVLDPPGVAYFADGVLVRATEAT